ncbi:hypothetical protein ILUMI_16378, partial [Ignelater luminosus]
KQVGQVSSQERGKLVTLVSTINAVGIAVPPAFVYFCVRNPDEYLKDCPVSSVAFGNKSGWMISELFASVLRRIVQYVNSSKDNQILLLLDNHKWHTVLYCIKYCRENGIILLLFPPHTTHRAQSLDVAKLARKAYTAFCDEDFMPSSVTAISLESIRGNETTPERESKENIAMENENGSASTSMVTPMILEETRSYPYATERKQTKRNWYQSFGYDLKVKQRKIEVERKIFVRSKEKKNLDTSSNDSDVSVKLVDT